MKFRATNSFLKYLVEYSGFGVPSNGNLTVHDIKAGNVILELEW